ncbi:MAG: hypothetical protein R3C19_14760 [Planctomycetaceae bacterium]
MFRTMQGFVVLAFTVAAFLTAANSRADDEKAAGELNVRKMIDETLRWITIHPASNATVTMEPKVVLRWTNNARGSETGATVLWIHQGRPEAACGIYPWQDHLTHEFDSLARRPIRGFLDGSIVWMPQNDSIEFSDLPDVDAPAATKLRRRRQINQLKDEFSATMLGWRADDTDREELRLMPRPLYEYETPEGAAVVDGAVFAFAQGTDPETILLLEAVTDGTSMKWQYAFVRQTSGALEGRFRQKVVWNAEKHPRNNNPADDHISFRQSLAGLSQ